MTQGDLGAKSIHKVVVVFIVVTMPDVTSSSFLFAVILRLLVEVWGLLHHGAMHHLLAIPWVAASCVAHRISLELVEPSSNAFNLGWKFDATALVQNDFVSLSNNKLIRN